MAEYFEVFENLIRQNPDLNPATAKDYNDKQLRERKLMKSQELKDVLAKISKAIRPRNTQRPEFASDKIEKIQTGQTQSTFSYPNNQDVNVRITRNIGYSGKTRIILIYDLFSSQVYYQAPELGYKLDPRFFYNQKNRYESPNIYNTVPKGHDPRRGIITHNWES